MLRTSRNADILKGDAFEEEDMGGPSTALRPLSRLRRSQMTKLGYGARAHCERWPSIFSQGSVLEEALLKAHGAMRQALEDALNAGQGNDADDERHTNPFTSPA